MRRAPSTIAELEKILGKSLFKTLLGQVFDQRELFKAAAQHVGLSQLDLMVKIANRLGLPLLTKLSDDFEKVPLLGVSDIEHESRGFVFFRIKSGAYAVACLEPRWLTPHAEKLNLFPLVLSDWDTLKKWLQSKGEATKPEQCLEIGGRPCIAPQQKGHDLKFFVAKIAALGANDVALEFADNCITYEMIAPDLHTYRRQIPTFDSKELEEYLSATALASPPSVSQIIDGVNVTIHVGRNTQRRKFHLSWTPSLPRTKAFRARLFSAQSRIL